MKIFCDIGNIKIKFKKCQTFFSLCPRFHLSVNNVWKLKEKWWNMKEENVAFKVIAARSG